MLAAVIILVFAIFTIFFIPAVRPEPEPANEDAIKKDPQLKKLWSLAQTAMKERKPLKAEKALLTILKFDEKNAAAYNRLGILYAKEKHYKEAIECVEIAQSLDNNASSLHNVGLIYYETGKYEKAAMAFEQAIEQEGDVPARYIALAKAEEKLGQTKKAVEALENAYELDPKVATLRQILAIHENSGNVEAVAATAARIEEQITKDNESKIKKAAAKRASSINRRAQSLSRKRVVASPKSVKPITKKLPAKSKTSPRIIKSHAGRKRI